MHLRPRTLRRAPDGSHAGGAGPLLLHGFLTERARVTEPEEHVLVSGSRLRGESFGALVVRALPQESSFSLDIFSYC